MALRINDTVPDFTAETDQGTIKFHDWIGDTGQYYSPTPKTSRRFAPPNSAQ